LTPLVESSGASFLENGPADEGAFLIEVVVNGAVEGCEFLQTSHPPEAEHGPFSSSEWLVRILHPVVQPTADIALMPQVLSIAQQERITDVHHHRQADDLGRCLEVAEDCTPDYAGEGRAGISPCKRIFP
jgi:hypothetical protein